MKPGSPLSDVVRRVDLLADQARDFVAPTRSLRMSIADRAPSLVLDDGSGPQPFGLTDLVHDQLATLTGVPLYSARGYVEAGQRDVPLRPGVSLPIVHMVKQL